MPSRDSTHPSSTASTSNDTTTASSDNTIMSSVAIMESNNNNNNNNFSLWPKKTHGIYKPITRSCIYSKNIIIPLNNNQEIISPIPSGHLETSTKFWQFRVEEGRTTYVRYGAIRADGSLKERATHIQQHPNNMDAKKFVENLVDEKIKAGYVGWARW